MAFDSFKSIAEVVIEYQITAIETPFIQAIPLPIDPGFRSRLDLYLLEFNFKDSESAVCEIVIFPILAEVYLHHRSKFVLWSHKTLTYDDRLTGVPDYTLAKRSPLGKVVWDKPYFVAVEAKKDDFVKGWGQCLAQMLAMQKLNGNPDQSVYGIVSNGQSWEFGVLTQSLFTQDPKAYSLRDLDDLIAALNFLFQQCEEELDRI
jgi:hypothetical protein